MCGGGRNKCVNNIGVNLFILIFVKMNALTIDRSRPFGMRHLLCACVFVPLRFYTILLPKAEAKAIDFSEQLSVQFNNKYRKSREKNEKRMINHAHTYQGKRYF